MVIKHPQGTWIWELAKISPDYLVRLKKQNCQRVYLKVFDGKSRQMFWAFQCSKALVDKFHNEGIEVYGWGYHYGTSDIDTQASAVRKALDCGLDGYIFDLEQEIKNPNTHDDVKKLLQAIRPYVKPGTLGYTSFGHPGFHPEIPWKLLDELCDLALPQMYFEKWGFGQDEDEVKAAIEAHRKIGLKKPILPIWGSEEDATRPATAAILQKFLTQHPGSSVWRLPNVGQRGEGWNLNYTGEPLVIGQEVPVVSAKPTQALFRMQLEDSTGLIVGSLFLFDANGKQIFDAVATSGQPGYQSPDDLWKPGEGPIPNLAGLEISTDGTVIESRDIKGLFFPILPYTFETPNGDVTRGGFGIYNDVGAPGTSGGIAIVNPSTYERFCEVMAGANKAGITKIALKVQYGGRSRAAVKPARALFRMQLANSSRLLWGNFFLFDAAGNQIFDAVATSGLTGTQGADDVWKVGVGPIPPRPGLTINTQGINMPTKVGINGWFFPVLPFWVNNPSGSRRGDFGVHWDANVPGSSGCIVIQNKGTFDRFRDIMVAARRAGVNQIPLQIDYLGTRSISISTRGERPAKGISIHIGLNRVDADHYQGWDGELNGCENDAKAMQAIAEQQGFESQLILTSQATANHVKQALTAVAEQLEPGDMLLLTYSGHGGQIPDLNSDEEDNLDETWVLYDRELLDDELYTLYGQFKEGVRIFVLSDSCHSGTVAKNRLYKHVLATEPTEKVWDEDYKIRTAESSKIRAMPQETQNSTYLINQRFYRRIQKENSQFDRNNIPASVILISGCQDNQLSLDGITNGFFTQTLLEVWKQGEFKGRYRDFRRDIALLMPPWQSPHYYTVGTTNPEFESQIPFTIATNSDGGEDANLGDSSDFSWNELEEFSSGNGRDLSSDDVQYFSLHNVPS